MPSRSWRSRPARRSCVLALKSVERARQVAERTPDARDAHVGYHLIGAGGRAVRDRASPGQPDLQQRVAARCSSRYATPGYLGTIAAGTAAARRDRRRLRAARTAGAAPRSVVVALLTLVPASELAIQLAPARSSAA